jgi:hypothetical protein
MNPINDTKMRIIEAGYQAVEHLIEVAKEKIIKPNADDELAADKLKNAAATKKLAIFDAFEILNRVEAEKDNLLGIEKTVDKTDTKQGFAERRSRT